jgi:hypothetical protein
MNVAIGRSHVSVALKQDLVNTVAANHVDWVMLPANIGWETAREAAWLPLRSAIDSTSYPWNLGRSNISFPLTLLDVRLVLQ